jgi:hypothetical protein
MNKLVTYSYMYNEKDNFIRIGHGYMSVAISNIGPRTAEFIEALVDVANSKKSDIYCEHYRQHEFSERGGICLVCHKPIHPDGIIKYEEPEP